MIQSSIYVSGVWNKSMTDKYLWFSNNEQELISAVNT